MDFVKRLEKILDYYNLTAAAFAEEIAFNRSTISHLLSGRNKPSLEFVMKLLQKFPDVEMNWLLFGKGNFPSTSENKTTTVSSKQKMAIETEKPKDLFSEENNIIEKKTAQLNQTTKQIEKIVIFYKDGSFNVYEN
ncbi:helix-turn-helix transcriptional regulator [Aequorivita sp. CIP111184]|uniref:helix-turn-helix domain-containing protein n=1 Tax=Aequorivita sp. CIP111184 TaxID=2211356 RepID=UPI000DBBBA43|nr:helix-turn-helix transcriptional regulator [Aequorivita sp. CIP111184]SRX55826.1 hypothetical protein AEQU1_02851 [Aequorivita sp. CIP111184]